jgi:hypothetical protein
MAQGSVTFLFDANLPSGLAEALRVLGESAMHVNDIFAPGTPDETWIQHAGERNWCIISRDMNITRKPHELAALREFSVGAFFLLPGRRSPDLCKIIQTVVRHWPELKQVAATERRPFQFEVRERSGVGRLR